MLGKTNSSQCRGLIMRCVYLFCPPKHKNVVMKQNSPHIVPCKKEWVLSQYTAAAEKQKNWLLAVVCLVSSLMHSLERAKQNCMHSEICCSLSSTALKSCCSEFFKSTEGLFLVQICQVRSSIAWQTGYK